VARAAVAAQVAMEALVVAVELEQRAREEVVEEGAPLIGEVALQNTSHLLNYLLLRQFLCLEQAEALAEQRQAQ
jgi:hypothetical protein